MVSVGSRCSIIAVARLPFHERRISTLAICQLKTSYDWLDKMNKMKFEIKISWQSLPFFIEPALDTIDFLKNRVP